MASLNFSTDARAEFDEAFNWYAERSVGAASGSLLKSTLPLSRSRQIRVDLRERLQVASYVD